MTDDKVPCCLLDAARKVRKLHLPNGVSVGISGLDKVLEEISQLGLKDEERIKAELLIRIRENNYIPKSGEKDYQNALYSEYVHFLKKK